MAGYQMTNKGSTPYSPFSSNLGSNLGNNAQSLVSSVAKARTTNFGTYDPKVNGMSKPLPVGVAAPAKPNLGVYNPAVNGQSKVPQPTTPIKKINNADGSSTEYHAPANDNAKKYGNAYVAPTKDAPYGSYDPSKANTGTTAQQNKNTAQQTTTESPYQSSYKGLIAYGQGNKNNPNVSTATTGLVGAGKTAQDIANAAGQKISDIGGQGARGQAGYLTTGTSPVGEGNAAILGQTTAAQQQAVAQGANMQLSGNEQNINALNNVGTLGTNQQGQNIGALGTAGSLVNPLGNTPYAIDPTTGQPIGGGNVNNAIINAGNYQTIAERTQAYNQGLTSLRAADNLQPQIEQTIKANNLNNTPVSAITNLQQWFAGQTSDPAQQQLSQLISTYIQTLGIDPATATNIAAQQKGTIGQLLNTLYDAAKAKNEGLNPATAPMAGQTTESDPLGIR